MLRLLILSVTCLASATTYAQYKCIAPDGVLEYRATPCPGSPEAKMRAAQRETQPPAPAAPNYWQREAARLERKEAAERAENDAWQREQRATAQAIEDRKQVAVDKALADQQAKDEERKREQRLRNMIRQEARAAAAQQINSGNLEMKCKPNLMGTALDCSSR